MKKITRREFNSSALIGLAGLLAGCGSRNDFEDDFTDLGSSEEERPKFWHRRKQKRQKDYVENLNGLNMKMIWIPGGELNAYEHYRGKRSDCPPTTISVSGFWMQETEMTIKQWLNYTGSSGYDFGRDTCFGRGGMPRDISNLDFPVTSVSPKNATWMAKSLQARTDKGYALPTPSQWVLAALAGSAPSEELFTPSNSNMRESGYGTCSVDREDQRKVDIEPVRSRDSNAYGLYGMYGNAGEISIPPIDIVREFESKHSRTNLVFSSPSILHGKNLCFEYLDGDFNSMDERWKTSKCKEEFYFSHFDGFRLARDPNLES